MIKVFNYKNGKIKIMYKAPMVRDYKYDQNVYLFYRYDLCGDPL